MVKNDLLKQFAPRIENGITSRRDTTPNDLPRYGGVHLYEIKRAKPKDGHWFELKQQLKEEKQKYKKVHQLIEALENNMYEDTRNTKVAGKGNGIIEQLFWVDVEKTDINQILNDYPTPEDWEGMSFLRYDTGLRGLDEPSHKFRLIPKRVSTKLAIEEYIRTNRKFINDNPSYPLYLIEDIERGYPIDYISNYEDGNGTYTLSSSPSNTKHLCKLSSIYRKISEIPQLWKQVTIKAYEKRDMPDNVKWAMTKLLNGNDYTNAYFPVLMNHHPKNEMLGYEVTVQEWLGKNGARSNERVFVHITSNDEQ